MRQFENPLGESMEDVPENLQEKFRKGLWNSFRENIYGNSLKKIYATSKRN